MDFCYSLKEAARHLDKTAVQDKMGLKHLIRYLVGTADMKLFLVVRKSMIECLRQGLVFVDTFTDSDWAKDKQERLSTTSCLSLVDRFSLKNTVVTQDGQVLSSGESEHYALGSGCRDSLYVRAVLKEIGFEITENPEKKLAAGLFLDSANAISNGMRLGPSKWTRHVDVRHHFVQRLRSKKEVSLNTILGEENVADLGTEVLATWKLRQMRLKACIGLEMEVKLMGPLRGDERENRAVEVRKL